MMPEGLELFHIAVSACIVFGAFVIRGMSGFGAGMIGVPLLALLMPVHTAVAMFGLLVLCLFAYLSVRDWGEVVKSELRLLMLPTLAGVAAGILLFSQIESRLLLKLLGGFLVGYALYSFAIQHFGLPQFQCSQRWAAPIAFVGAVLDTLFGGGGGALVVIYLHLRRVGHAQFRATVAVLWLAEMVARIAGYGAVGIYSTDVLLLCALLLPVMAAGTWVGERLGNRISQEAFSRLLALLLFLGGVGLLVK